MTSLINPPILQIPNIPTHGIGLARLDHNLFDVYKFDMTQHFDPDNNPPIHQTTHTSTYRWGYHHKSSNRIELSQLDHNLYNFY